MTFNWYRRVISPSNPSTCARKSSPEAEEECAIRISAEQLVEQSGQFSQFGTADVAAGIGEHLLQLVNNQYRFAAFRYFGRVDRDNRE
jgi:hypothetical protein